MADAINPGSAILERIGVSSSWIMVDYKVFPLSISTHTVNEYEIACIISYSGGGLNLPGLFLSGGSFSVIYSNSGSTFQLIQSSSSTSVTIGMNSSGKVSILFYKFPSE